MGAPELLEELQQTSCGPAGMRLPAKDTRVGKKGHQKGTCYLEVRVCLKLGDPLCWLVLKGNQLQSSHFGGPFYETAPSGPVRLCDEPNPHHRSPPSPLAGCSGRLAEGLVCSPCEGQKVGLANCRNQFWALLAPSSVPLSFFDSIFWALLLRCPKIQSKEDPTWAAWLVV